jgi:hypothetical protein
MPTVVGQMIRGFQEKSVLTKCIHIVTVPPMARKPASMIRISRTMNRRLRIAAQRLPWKPSVTKLVEKILADHLPTYEYQDNGSKTEKVTNG